MNSLPSKLPGILLTLVIALPAWLLGKAFPIIGGPVLGILFGMVLSFWQRPALFDQGIKYTAKKFLQFSIILLGFDMNLYNVFQVGSQTLLLMIFTLSATFAAAYLTAKMLHINGKTATLIGVGTAICGGSAIAATAPVIEADDESVAHAISTIFFFNVLAAFLFPLLGHLLGMDDNQFGLWAGTAINDTSSVVAAAYSYSDSAGNLAVIVKLTRTLMIIPITIFLSFYVAKKKKEASRFSLARVFPFFILGFIAASIISTFLPISPVFTGSLAKLGKFLIIMAMAAIGLNANIVTLIKSGKRPLLMGAICWAVLAIVALLTQYSLL